MPPQGQPTESESATPPSPSLPSDDGDVADEPPPRPRPSVEAAATNGKLAKASSVTTPVEPRATATPVEPRATATPVARATATPAAPRTDTASASPLPNGEPRPSVAKPLLASEALMDDLAPMQPAREAARLWCAALGVGALVLGAVPVAGLRPGGLGAAFPSFVLGAIAIVAALARVSYRQRALAMVVLGGIAAVLGLEGSGPAAGIGVGGFAWGLMRFVGAIALSAALVFRARYRAFRGARFLLGAGYAAALPFLIHAVGLLLTHHAFGPSQIGAAIALVAVLASLTGFMGSETTGAGSYTAMGVIAALSIQLGLEALADAPIFGPGGAAAVLGAALATAAFAGTAAVVALGCFQILAGRFAADARRIDLHAPIREKPKLDSSNEDWPTQ